MKDIRCLLGIHDYTYVCLAKGPKTVPGFTGIVPGPREPHMQCQRCHVWRTYPLGSVTEVSIDECFDELMDILRRINRGERI